MDKYNRPEPQFSYSEEALARIEKMEKAPKKELVDISLNAEDKKSIRDSIEKSLIGFGKTDAYIASVLSDSIVESISELINVKLQKAHQDLINGGEEKELQDKFNRGVFRRSE